jgi:predicted  nucleic acid-binding Zn-ribbon protein
VEEFQEIESNDRLLLLQRLKDEMAQVSALKAELSSLYISLQNEKAVKSKVNEQVRREMEELEEECDAIRERLKTELNRKNGDLVGVKGGLADLTAELTGLQKRAERTEALLKDRTDRLLQAEGEVRQ